MLAGYPVHVLYPTVAVPMNQRMIAQFLKRVSEATVEAVVIMPCWSGNNLTAALEMAVEPPLLKPADWFGLFGLCAFVRWK